MPSDRSVPVRLVVLFGGQSAEHDVSCTTAAHVLAAVDPERYQVEPVAITRTGEFLLATAAIAALGTDPSELHSLPVAGEPVEATAVVAPVEGAVTVVLPLLHGPLGEDGTVQGMLELAGVPYVGSGVLGSAVAMDKAMTKTVLAAHGLPQARWLAVNQFDVDADAALVAKTAAEELGLPVFVKPANMGSSVGVSKATDEAGIVAALAEALRYDEVAVVEEAVEAREIELAVLGNHDLAVSIPGEIVPGAEFYDYNDKYHDGNAELLIPAPLDDDEIERFQQLAGQAYRALRVEGMARADFLYEEGGRGPLVNELNTIPGFTPISMYPKLWEASGLSYPDLIDRLIDLAIERHDRRATKRITDH
ncbi:MAG: D-alanine--D-alanine ligase family protein [Acidimicrobiales bacterium]